MRCRKVRSSLSAYSKGELTEQQSAKIKNHLAECPSCRREEEVFRSVNKLVDGVPALKASDDFNARLFQKIEREGFAQKKPRAYLPGRIPRFGAARLATVAAMAVIVIAFGIGINFADGILGPSSPEMAIAEPTGGDGSEEDLYLTVQPTDNPFLNERKSVSQMIQQYNRWRQYSQSLRSHSAMERFFGGAASNTLASSRTGFDRVSGHDIRIRPVVKNYLVVPENQKTVRGRNTY